MFDEQEWQNQYDVYARDACSQAQWSSACKTWCEKLLAGVEDPPLAVYGAQKFAWVLQLAEEGPVRFLDVGGGYGWTSLCLLNSNPNISSTSLDPALVCKERGEQLARGVQLPVAFVHSTLENYEASPENFDAINASEVLEHVQDPCAFLEKVHSLLRPGGIFVGDTPVEGLANGLGHLHYFEQPDIIKLEGVGSMAYTVGGGRWNLRELLSRYFVDVEIWYVQTGDMWFNKFFGWRCRRKHEALH